MKMKDNKRTVQHDDTSRKGPTSTYYEVRHESLVNHNSGCILLLLVSSIQVFITPSSLLLGSVGCSLKYACSVEINYP
jgi:hypothetical protein